MAHNAADEKKVREAEQRNKNQRETELEDIKDILSRPSGVRFFRRMTVDAKMFSTTFTGNSNGFFLEGGRNFFLRYFDDVCQAAPDKVIDLVLRREEEVKDDSAGAEE